MGTDGEIFWGEGSYWFFKFVFKKARPLVEKRPEKQPCQGSIADTATFPLFSQAAKPEGQTDCRMGVPSPP